MRQAETLNRIYLERHIFLGTKVGVADLYYYPHIWNSLQAVISNNFINVLVSEVKKKNKTNNKTNLSQHCGKGSFHNELQRADMFSHTVSHSRCRAFKSCNITLMLLRLQ